MATAELEGDGVGLDAGREAVLGAKFGSAVGIGLAAGAEVVNACVDDEAAAPKNPVTVGTAPGGSKMPIS